MSEARNERKELNSTDLLAIRIESAYSNRDAAIPIIWSCMRDISELLGDKMTAEDLDVWMAVTKHSAVQNKLSTANAEVTHSAKK